MRAAVAILLAGLLMWSQAMAAASPVVHVESAACCCCDCGKRDCCCSTTAPSNPQPLPTAAARLTTQAQAKLLKPAVTESRPVFVSTVLKNSFPPVPQRALALPLFQRHCALLI